jgi:hypothetical protein
MPQADIVMLDSQRFLDVSEMTAALRFQPSDFEYSRGFLVHVPSRHRFWFNHEGRLTIMARCGCSGRSIRPDQSQELYETYLSWRSEYWQPLQADRKLASRLYRDLKAALLRFLGKVQQASQPAAANASELASRNSVSA